MSDNQKKENIRIGRVEGDVTISQNQSGGIASHDSGANNSENSKQGKLNWKWIFGAIGFIGSIASILAYLNLSPNPQETKPMTHEDEKISIDSIQGNVVTSKNQSGGITAHSVNINNPVTPEWTLSPSEQIGPNEWRTKLAVIGKGNLAFYNWNRLFTLNTPVIRREDVPDEVTVGPWEPLKITGGMLHPNQFFLGFSEFKPDQRLAIYLYSKEFIELLQVQQLKER